MKFIEILQQFNVPYRQAGHEHCRAGWVQIDCPWCSPGWQHWRLGYSLITGRMNCWACGGQNLMKTLIEVTKQPYHVLKDLVEDIHLDWVADLPQRGTLKLPYNVMSPLLNIHRNYLSSRGFDPDEIEKIWGLQSIGWNGGSLSWRIFIPIKWHAETVSWTTRSILDHHRYRSASVSQEKYNHKDLLYGEDFCRHTIIVCEGPTDVWKIGPGAVATMGTSFTQAQVLKMSKYPTRVICFDNEKAAQRRARQLVNCLAPFDGTTFNVTLDSKDPGSARASELHRLQKRFLS